VTPFDQHDAACRCEWGVDSLDVLERADVVIVVDVLSFSTCVDIAVARGATILPHPWKDTAARELAARRQAVLAVTRGEPGYSLSPASFLQAPSGLRCVLPSPNGAAVALRAAAAGATVLAGCLRNHRAVAAAACERGSTFNVCPAGERWPDGSLRFAIEDWLGAGAILRGLPGRRSPEASAAIAAFESARHALGDHLSVCASGLELARRGFAHDVELAAQLDVSPEIPLLEEGAFINVP
jgi:2-phosphosulfolactate phosphatase